MQNYEPKIMVIVALFNPSIEELNNISKYIRACDLCILKDDSENENKDFVLEFFTKRNIENFEYIWNKKNIGLCASINGGILIALENKFDWVLLMNGDSIFDELAIHEFKKYIKNNMTSKISCLVPQYNYDRHPRKACKGTKKILWSNMSGMCINCKSLNRIGMFDERFFIDGLDLDWGIRSRRAGYEIIEIGNIVMDHHPAETREFKILGRILFRYGWANPIRYYYQFRAQHYMIKKYKSLEAFKWQCIKLIKVLLLFDNKREYWRMFVRAIKDCNDGKWGKYNAKY